MDRYRNVIANIIATLLRETKDHPGADVKVSIEVLREIYDPDPESDEPSLEDLLEYVSNMTTYSITLGYKSNNPVITISDKVGLYLTLRALNYNLATADLLHWKDFEELCEHALQENGFLTTRNFRFKDINGKRHEVDVIAVDRFSKDHVIFLVDSKHWDHKTSGSPARIIEAANDQVARAFMMGDSPDVVAHLLAQLKLNWNECVLVPLVVTLLTPPISDFYVPIVSILSFNNFIQEFSNNMDFYKKRHVEIIPPVGDADKL